MEKSKTERVQSSGIGSTEQGESSIVIHPDFEINQPQKTETEQDQAEISEVITVESVTGELSDTQLTEPKISELESDSTSSESPSDLIAPTPPHPRSPRVKLLITENLPPGLISIEEISDK